MHHETPLIRRLFVCTLLLWGATTALAVKPAHWTHRSADDYKDAETEQVAVGQDGAITLSRAMKALMERHPDVEFVHGRSPSEILGSRRDSPTSQ